MSMMVVLGLCALFGALIAGSVLVYLVFMRPASDRRFSTSLMGRHEGSHSSAEGQIDIQGIKDEVKQRNKKKGLTLDEKFFQAGLYSPADRESFFRMRKMAPLVGGIVGFFVAWNLTDLELGLLLGIIAALCGYQLPMTILDRQIKGQQEEIMYYLPLVIEQIAIGVSSSLDVGPCISRVVDMADERDTHNAVTQLLRFSQNYVKSGASLEEAMTEVGVKSGHTELKHTFMSLAQVAKHGGELTRQLQELADAVAMQREAKVEEIIKKLELKATGPVGLVFLGFMVILLVSFGLQVQKAF